MTDFTVPAELAAWMRDKGFTEERLARILGLSVYQVARWRQGRRGVRPLMQRALADAGRSPGELSGPWAALVQGGGGAWLEAWRYDLGLSRPALARLVGSSATRIGEWETNTRTLTVCEARALREAGREARRRQPKPRA